MDRRQQHRRTEDAAAWYALQLVIAKADEAVEHGDLGPLADALATYRTALEQVETRDRVIA